MTASKQARIEAALKLYEKTEALALKLYNETAAKIEAEP